MHAVYQMFQMHMSITSTSMAHGLTKDSPSGHLHCVHHGAQVTRQASFCCDLELLNAVRKGVQQLNDTHITMRISVT